jgi:hypothetical protein
MEKPNTGCLITPGLAHLRGLGAVRLRLVRYRCAGWWLNGAAPVQDAIQPHQRYWVQDADRRDGGHDSNWGETKVSAGAEGGQFRSIGCHVPRARARRGAIGVYRCADFRHRAVYSHRFGDVRAGARRCVPHFRIFCPPRSRRFVRQDPLHDIKTALSKKR